MSVHQNRGFEKKRGLSVEVRGNNIEAAIRTLGRKVKQEGLMRELRARQAYEKPSAARCRRKVEARTRHLKTLSQQDSNS